MWPINYENSNKLHMSIGIGLLVAGYIILLLHFDYSHNSWETELDNLLEDKIKLNQINDENFTEYFLQQRGVQETSIGETMNFYKNISIALLIGGLLFFFTGYIPYLYKENRKGK